MENNEFNDSSFNHIETMVIHEEEVSETQERYCGSARLFMAFMLSFCTFTLYSQRQSLNMTIHCMIDKESLMQNLELSHIQNFTCRNQLNLSEDILPGKYAWSKTGQGLLLGAFYWGYCFQIFGGLFSASIGYKYALTIAVSVSSAATILIPFAAEWSLMSVVILRFITGLSQSLIYPSVFPLIGKWSTTSEKSKIASIVIAGCSVGIIFATFISGPICSTGYWQFNFIIVALLGFSWLLPWNKFASNSPKNSRLISRYELEYLETHREQTVNITNKSPLTWPIIEIFTSPSIWVILATNVFSDFTLYGILAVFPSYLEEVYAINITKNSYIAAGQYGFMLFVTVASGVLSNYFIKYKVLSKLNTRKLFNSIGMILPAILFPLVTFIDCSGIVGVIIMLILAGGFPGAYQSSGFLINALDVSGPYSGLVVGLSNSLGSITGILAPYVAHSITEDMSIIQWRTCFFVFGGLLMFGGVIFIIFSKAELESWAKIKPEARLEIFKNSKESLTGAAIIKMAKSNASITSDDMLVPDSFENQNQNFANSKLVPKINLEPVYV